MQRGMQSVIGVAQTDRVASPSCRRSIVTVSSIASAESWPALPLAAWRDSCATLQRWVQIVGKLRLRYSPWVNHSWHATLYVTAHGLTTSPIPFGKRSFQVDFDFTAHHLLLRSSDGRGSGLALQAESVASFHGRLMEALARLDLPVTIHPYPNELEDCVRFDQDVAHCSYDPEYVRRYWEVLVHADRVFKQFRAGFIGKCSPVHLFWGALDLAVTRFSGQPAPVHPGGIPHLPDWVTREAYSHEVSSCGFWPGGGGFDDAAFYAYAYPEPGGFRDARIDPPQAYYSETLREFLLPYDAVRQSADPDTVLLEFLHTTYAAAADSGRWDRAALERKLP